MSSTRHEKESFLISQMNWIRNLLDVITETLQIMFNPLNAELNPICQLLALLGAHHIFHVSGLRVNEVAPKRSTVM